VLAEKSADSEKREFRIGAQLLIAASVVSWILVLWAFNAARYLRPVADDYCIGVRGELGPIGGFVNDYLTWSGFVTPSFLTNLLVGVPLAHGPLWIASSATFILAGLSLALLAATTFGVIGGFGNGVKTWFIRVAALTPLAIISWWTFLWFSTEMSTESPMDELAIGLTHWQNLNSAYVTPTALILAASLLLLRGSLKRTWLTAILSAVLGLVSGMMGPTFGMAALLTLLLIAGWLALRKTEGSSRQLLDLLIAGLGVIVGLGIAYLSPGTQARAKIFESNEVTFAPNSIVGWIMAIIPENLTMFGELLFHWGGLIIVVFFFGVGFFATKMIETLASEKALPIAIGLASFGVALSSATIITDALSYSAYWHSSSIAVVAYGVCASVGFWCGGILSRQGFKQDVLVAAFALLIGVTAGVGSTLDLSESIVERESVWRDGAAPIPGIIEDREVDWIDGCATQLELINPSIATTP
jgi:hypothetical protein